MNSRTLREPSRSSTQARESQLSVRFAALLILLAVAFTAMFSTSSTAQSADPMQVSIDVIPGQTDNVISLGTSFAIPVAILSNGTFDAASIDPESLTLSGGPVAKDDQERLSTMSDLNGDGSADMLVYFAADYTKLDENSSQVTLQGSTKDGIGISGVDSVRCVRTQPQAGIIAQSGPSYAMVMAQPAFFVGYAEAIYNYFASFFSSEAATLLPAVDTVSTFTNNQKINIPGTGTSGIAHPYPSTINVSGVTGSVKKVTVTLDGVNHGFPDDMDILLVAPDNQTALVILSDAGGNPDIKNLKLTFDDNASSKVQDTGLIESDNAVASFIPTNHASSPDNFVAPAPSTYSSPGGAGDAGTARLSIFNSVDPNGLWRLYVRDDSNGDTGFIERGWSISITTGPSDTTPPNLSLPANIIEEATSPSGNVVNYSATATDSEPANPTVTCSPASGTTFAVTTTTVNCSATDSAGNQATGSFTVKVQDTTAPQISITTNNVTVDGTSAAGAVVNFSGITATDIVDSTPTITYSPASGSTFAIGGPHTVIVTAKDDFNNTAMATFTVTVNKLATSVNLSPATIIYGQSVPQNATLQNGPNAAIISYTVASGANVPAGSPAFGPISNPLPAGSYTLKASYAGDSTYAASEAVANLTVNKAATQTVVTCTGGPFTYSGSALTPCSAKVTGPAGLDQTLIVSYSDNTNAGTATASAAYTESANYTGSSDSETFEIGKAASTTVVACGSGPFTYTGSPITPCSATVSGPGLAEQSLTVSYSNNVGAGTASASASFAETANHLASSDSENFEIGKAGSTTTVTCSGPVTYNGSPQTPCTATATGAGGLNVTLTVSYSNNVNSGSASASASFAGDANHEGSSDTESFTIDKASSTTTVTCGAGPFTYTGSAITPCEASVTGAGGLNQPVTVTYQDNTNAGTATASASYAGDNNHNGSNDSKTFQISKATTTTVVTCEAGPFVYTGTAFTPCTAKVTGPSLEEVLTVSYSDNTNAGQATASANYAGSANYEASSDSETFNIDKATSTTVITCNPTTVVYNGAEQTPCTAKATGAGSLDVTVQVVYDNNKNAGTATADAEYEGDANHEGSTAEQKTFTIEKALPTVTVTGGPFTYDGNPKAATATAAGVNSEILQGSFAFTYTPAGAPVNAGTYQVTANFTSTDQNYKDATGSGSITINRAASTTEVTFESGPYAYRASAFTATAKVTGAGGLNESVSVSYSGNCTNVTVANGCTATAIYAESTNHLGSSDSKSITITAIPLTITATNKSKIFGDTVTFDMTTPSSDFSVSAMLGTDSVASVTITSTGADANATVGTHDILISGANGSGLGNYNITYNKGTLTIQAWTLKGFYQPVGELNTYKQVIPLIAGVTLNTIKGGQTVPLKFNIFAGQQERTDVGAIKSFTTQELTCPAGTAVNEDPVDLTTTGGTTLRYAGTAGVDGQFIQNWQTPKTADRCYRVVMTAQDGSVLSAFFKTKK